MKLDGLLTFVAIADAGSLSEAARQLRLSTSVVSERLAELERFLDARLVQRTTRKLTLTPDGIAFYARARQIVQQVAEATAEMSERRGELTGPLRIAGPVSFGNLHLGPALYPFLARHPGIELALDLDDRFVDAAADGYDAVIRHGAVLDTRLVVKSLAISRRLLVASPDYLARHGTPSNLPELERHRAILFTNRGHADWRFQHGADNVVVRAGHCLRVNNGMVMRDAAIAGLGIALLPTFLVSDAVVAGQLQVIEVGAEAEGAEVHIAYPRDRRVSAKVLALIECLREAFGNPPVWDVAMRAHLHGHQHAR
jgi:DNA-binding transcriptional LysR family regulator